MVKSQCNRVDGVRAHQPRHAGLAQSHGGLAPRGTVWVEKGMAGLPSSACQRGMDVKGLGHGRKTKWGPALVSDSPKVTVGTQRSLIRASLLE